MDTRNSAIRIVAAFFLTVVFTSVGFPGSVYIYGGDFNLPIPAPDDSDPYISKGWMADAVIEIPHHFIITDLDVKISLQHSNVFDLQIFLQGPDGNEICLNMYDYDEFFIDANYTDTVFDDEAPVFIKDGSAPFTGRFRPLDKLSKFNNTDACGSWRLRIYDAWDWDRGTLNRLEIMITAPEPAAVILLTVGVCLMRLPGDRKS